MGLHEHYEYLSNPEWKDGTPAGFFLEDDERPGRVYRAAQSKTPPMRVRECSDLDYGEAIVVEYEDYQLKAGKEMFGQDMDPCVRLVFHPKDARFLTVALIEALRTGGDVVAERLGKVIDEVYEEGPPDDDPV
jgi:hypothetical protein